MNAVIRFLKKILLAAGGVLGGAVIGLVLWAGLFHARVGYGLDIPSPWLVAGATMIGSLLAGLVFPGFFVFYFLFPLSWLLSGDGCDSTGHPAGGPDETWKTAVMNLTYLAGLTALFSGSLFSMPMIFAGGVLLILFFTGMLVLDLRNTRRKKPEPPGL